MSEIRSAIILQSELNPWIDICIIPDKPDDLEKVRYFAEKVYDDWFDYDTDEPIVDYLKRRLDEYECYCTIYCADEDEEEC
jgi:hypothetical protein